MEMVWLAMILLSWILPQVHVHSVNSALSNGVSYNNLSLCQQMKRGHCGSCSMSELQLSESSASGFSLSQYLHPNTLLRLKESGTSHEAR